MHFAPGSFSDQVIVITGAGRGIGYQISRSFGALGGTVILAELSEEGYSAETSLRAEGMDAHFVQVDVSNPMSVSDLQNYVLTRFGKVDVLINNAICIHESPVIEMQLDKWDQIIAVNLRGTFLICRAFLPSMLEHHQGTILNLVSTDAMPGLSAYIASKQGIVGFTQSLALELEGTGINTIPFAPGMVDTPGIRSVAAGLAPRLGLTEDEFLHISLHAEYDGLMPPEHAAAAAVFLVSNLAGEYNGMVVNGYEVLEKAGVLTQEAIPLIDEQINGSPTTKSQTEYLDKLEEILNETVAELNQLPVFVKPIAKQGFKQKAGISLSDWKTLVNDIGEGKPIPINFNTRLEKLAKYYRDVPKETARFTHDKEILERIANITNERLEVIKAFQSNLS